jgi:hypothetical protein
MVGSITSPAPGNYPAVIWSRLPSRPSFINLSRCRCGGIAASAAAASRRQTREDIRNLFPIQRISWLFAFGRQRALRVGMLRITLPPANSSEAFILEGRLTGLWAQELLRVARGANQGYGNIFNLQEVFYVDSAGEEALRLLGRRGARFITESAYGKDLCHRLKLRRVVGSEVDNNNAKRQEGSCKPRQRRIACAGRLDALAAERSSSGK